MTMSTNDPKTTDLTNTEQAPRRLVVIGQGYVGLPLALRAVEVGYDVVGLDLSTDRIKSLASGVSFIEDIPHARLQAALDSGRYLPTTDEDELAGFDIAVIDVPTPLAKGSPDLSYVISATASLAKHLRRNGTVILESTSYPGTTEDLMVPMLEAGSGLLSGIDFHAGYSPERIDPGNPTWTFENTPKVVSGINATSLVAVQSFYDDLVDTTVAAVGTREAEMAKLLENTYRHVNIALVNDLAMFSAEIGADVWNVIDCAATKPFGFMKFTPGPGVGGHCLPIDPSYLSWSVEQATGRPFRFVDLANEVNENMPGYVVQRVMKGLNRRRQALNGSRVLVLGVTYKANTRDARESPGLDVVHGLQELGADVVVVDPHIRGEAPAPLVELTIDEVEAADVVVLITDHDGVDYDLVTAHASYVLDTRNRLAGPTVEAL